MTKFAQAVDLWGRGLRLLFLCISPRVKSKMSLVLHIDGLNDCLQSSQREFFCHKENLSRSRTSSNEKEDSKQTEICYKEWERHITGKKSNHNLQMENVVTILGKKKKKNSQKWVSSSTIVSHERKAPFGRSLEGIETHDSGKLMHQDKRKLRSLSHSMLHFVSETRFRKGRGCLRLIWITVEVSSPSLMPCDLLSILVLGGFFLNYFFHPVAFLV